MTSKGSLGSAITTELARLANTSRFDQSSCRVFVGDEEDVRHVLAFKLLDATPPARCTPVLGTLIPAVEKVLSEVNPRRVNALTLSQDATNRLPVREPVVVKQVDARTVANALWTVFQKTAGEYFRTRSDLPQIERALNSDLEVAVPDASLYTRRAEVGIVLARIVARTDYEALAGAYVARVNEFYRAHLRALIVRCRGDIAAG